MNEIMSFVARLLDLATGGALARAIASAAREHWAPERVTQQAPHGR